MNAETVQQALAELADPSIAEHSQRFFKSGPGEYGEGDRFRGIRVPVQRKVAQRFDRLPLDETERLLHSPFHEDRLTALLILVRQYGRRQADRQAIYDLYLRNTQFINNWDLVDSSAPQIVGAFLVDKPRAILDELARSSSLWERRIAIMATQHFIKLGEFDDTLRLARILLHDREDLIHKAVGWMLREVGNRDLAVEEAFLAQTYQTMPRTMLRYAIEKFPEDRRKAYLVGEV
ncbi:MAG: DNA alkylation repair protein [Caldilineaceae bacterium]|nr:DNA alkylation repair protein [Caldilineaceae bacterium]